MHCIWHNAIMNSLKQQSPLYPVEGLEHQHSMRNTTRADVSSLRNCQLCSHCSIVLKRHHGQGMTKATYKRNHWIRIRGLLTHSWQEIWRQAGRNGAGAVALVIKFIAETIRLTWLGLWNKIFFFLNNPTADNQTFKCTHLGEEFFFKPPLHLGTSGREGVFFFF